MGKYSRKTRGVGYIGEGEYSTTDNNGRNNLVHQKWYGMLTRCYDPYYMNESKNANYRSVFVCEDWLCFQNFAQWFYDNYYKIDGCTMELDKDLIGDGKLYSPENCCIIPHKLNSFLSKEMSTNTTGYMGVTFNKNNQKYRAPVTCVKTGIRLNRGSYETKKEAHEAYLSARFEQAELMKDMCINDWGITDDRIISNIE